MEQRPPFALNVSAKCACTSLKTWYLEMFHPELKLDASHRRYANLVERPYPPDIPIYQFVRNPVDRIVSCYGEKIANPSSRLYRKVSFSEFIQGLYDDRKEEFFWNNHWRPQHLKKPFLENPPTEVFRIEDGIQPALDTICARHGLTAKPIQQKNVFAYPNGKHVPTPDELAMITQIYEKDFILGGYEIPRL